MNRLPLTVSSSLTNLKADGASLQLTAYANETPTSEKAPVLLAVQSATHVDADAFASLLCEEGGQGTPAQARLLINALASVFSALVEKYGAITVNTPFGTVQTFIAGTLENAQDTPDPATNYPFLAVVVPEVYRKLFASFETYVPADASPVTLRRVRDKETNSPCICGTQPFYLEGSNMTFGGAGETLELLDSATGDKLCDVSVGGESKSMVQFTCELAPQTAIAAGEYKLRLTTLAGGETTLWPVELKVTLVEAIPAPAPTKEVTITDVTAIMYEDTAYLTVKGVNLDGLRGWRVDEANDLHFKAEVFVNGTSQGEQEFYGPNVDPAQEQFGEITCVDFGVGDTVKVVLRTDPAKTEFVQEEIVREVTVTQT